MDESLFLYAVVPLSVIQENEVWLTDDDHPRFVSVDALDFEPQYILDVFQLYLNSY